VPVHERPSLFRARGKALVLLAVVGGGVLGATALSFVGTFGSSYGLPWKIGSVALSALLDFVLFWAAFRLLTVAAVGWRETWPGALAATVAYELLQTIGSFYVDRVVRGASAVYGTFAAVIGLLSWIYLAATLLLYAAELNAVVARRLWPRGLSAAADEPAAASAPAPRA
jgi:YihY family inner membrane protein